MAVVSVGLLFDDVIGPPLVDPEHEDDDEEDDELELELQLDSEFSVGGLFVVAHDEDECRDSTGRFVLEPPPVVPFVNLLFAVDSGIFCVCVLCFCLI